MEAEDAEGVGPGKKGEKKKPNHYGGFVCDLTFSIGLQMQTERAGASSGTVNKVMYFCGVRAARGDSQGHRVPHRERAASRRQPDRTPVRAETIWLCAHLSSLTLLKATR